MSGIKSFVLGFGISLASVSFIGQLYSSSSINKTPPSLDQKIQIQLFKNAEAGVVAKSVDIPPLVNKKTISSTEFKIASIPESTNTQTNGIEDDEIISQFDELFEEVKKFIEKIYYKDIPHYKRLELLYDSDFETIVEFMKYFNSNKRDINAIKHEKKILNCIDDVIRVSNEVRDIRDGN